MASGLPRAAAQEGTPATSIKASKTGNRSTKVRLTRPENVGPPLHFRPARSSRLASSPPHPPTSRDLELHTMSGLISSTIDSIRGTSGGKSKLLKKSPDDGESLVE
ncbi:hypothetical protein C6P46_002068 [Rhodotorula mucilaginosa]|jgi:hypothetical protein|uniref:Uncharacterized protein n=1 Tax=Rhodotorula mucilaginosa TaxID=5537 RepID=A0A9P7B1S2_RHOMI|nr:hypothetical protein C6P46_002068 [Rhodotorula mucilaginosa]TKA51091.1 hypothetical protein B0A53_05877 [Rhodotorula sp. CCFEE 5036]